jgi:hypothetical protein
MITIFVKELNVNSASEHTLEYIARYIDIGCQERNKISKRKVLVGYPHLREGFES